ncbi:hypothetical protein M409DRAFT_59041 [Zasmidium cellare ATCC 36951]|uniref:Uncharacterized protein n=1 Tax=Zasmidium cellare ATCC 36951 TaxID=1080233 RepID=A0A6A6C3R9_ZASCE|nr:uncharacterized protein M409DRAFT_59041 [Zasmidium cellare ATCC 36951]KAF2161661.1 hypothetical protein M409DRAFT_59041 [Zasmidium cellare ATCC 36951]
MGRPKLSARNVLSHLKRRAASMIKSKKPAATAAAAAPAQQPAECHFFKLPAEVRINIYECAFSDFHPSPTKNDEYTHTRTASAPLLQTCRLIRREAIGFYCDRLRELAREVRECYDISSQALNNHMETVRLHIFRREYGEAAKVSEVFRTMSQAMTFMAEYRGKINLGTANKIGDLMMLGYSTGYWWAEEYLRELKRPWLESERGSRRVDLGAVAL